MTDTMTSQNIDLSSWDTLYLLTHKCAVILNFVFAWQNNESCKIQNRVLT